MIMVLYSYQTIMVYMDFLWQLVGLFHTKNRASSVGEGALGQEQRLPVLLRTLKLRLRTVGVLGGKIPEKNRKNPGKSVKNL